MLKINKTTETLSIIDTDILLNDEISLSAKGLYATIMNRRGGKIEIEEILKTTSDKKEDVELAIKELVEKNLIATE